MTGGVILKMLLTNFVLDVGKDLTPLPIPSCTNSNVSVCYNIYGFPEEFSLRVPWAHTPTRPVLKTPSSPESLDTRLWLFSQPNQTQPHEINLHNISSLYECPFNPEGKLWVLIHGFKSSGVVGWVRSLRSELLRLPGANNVIVVNWRKGSGSPYTQAVANLRVVARQVAYLIDAVETAFGFPPEKIHLVAHSLGAHMSGLAGEYMRTKYNKTLHRISGLDPANPYHSVEEPITGLDRTDAEFVDVIHSDNSSILGFPISVGMMDPLGDLDFYPNGGGNQPGCENEGRKCPHVRAILLFIDSIRQECPFITVKCPSYQMFLEGECWGCDEPGSCSLMGLNAAPVKGSGKEENNTQYYFLTKDRSPYCDYQYRVSISVSNTTAAFEHDGEFGILLLQMDGSKGSADPIRLSERTVYYQAGSLHKYVVLAPDIGIVNKVRITFFYPGHFVNPMSWRMSRPRLHLNKVSIEKLNSEMLTEFCFESEEQDSDIEYILDEGDSC